MKLKFQDSVCSQATYNTIMRRSSCLIAKDVRLIFEQDVHWDLSSVVSDFAQWMFNPHLTPALTSRVGMYISEQIVARDISYDAHSTPKIYHSLLKKALDAPCPYLANPPNKFFFACLILKTSTSPLVRLRNISCHCSTNRQRDMLTSKCAQKS